MAQIFGDQIRFGIHAGQQQVSYADYLHLWQTVEEMGYDWASVFDHFIPIMSNPEGPCFEGLTLLAALAAKTSRIRCGMLVIGNTYRHPAVLANAAATIDHVSGGRLELGIGAGWWVMEHEEYGIAFPPTGTRIRMCGEAAHMLRLLWTEHRATFKGRYYELTEALCEPKPVQNPLPLWVGGAGEQLTLRIVAESADGWNTFWMAPEAYRHKLDVLAEHCQAVGRDPNDIRKSLVFQAIVGDNAAEVRERAERVAKAWNVSPDEVANRAVVGSPEQAAEQILRYHRELGVGDFLLGTRVPYDYQGLEVFMNRVVPLVRQELARR